MNGNGTIETNTHFDQKSFLFTTSIYIYIFFIILGNIRRVIKGVCYFHVDWENRL